MGHWPSAPLAAAWRAYSQLYGAALLPVLDRREPTFLEYLMVRQLHPTERNLQLDARYEALCQTTTLYRLATAPLAPVEARNTSPVTVENVAAGVVDFQALVAATRQKLQRDFERGRATRRLS
ncbi:hypothetical protein [Deinococcus multiflagellatus]|uniref:Uncharacterized protein n=1 Tax=Deinococcus multiflagellatus TaxID=1656887 RepID=A0ABW1ZNQ6_9DEIO